MSGRELIETAELFRSDSVVNFDRYNSRFTFSFEVVRDVAFKATAPSIPTDDWTSPEQAFHDTAMHIGGLDPTKGAVIRGTGTLTVAITGQPTLTFHNCVKQSIELIEWLGIAIGYSYTFVCGYVTTA